MALTTTTIIHPDTYTVPTVASETERQSKILEVGSTTVRTFIIHDDSDPIPQDAQEYDRWGSDLAQRTINRITIRENALNAFATLDSINSSGTAGTMTNAEAQDAIAFLARAVKRIARLVLSELDSTG